jgi:XTP/dITP diphosphohydrolase
MKKLLIATTNNEKFEEIKKFLLDLPVELLSLNDLDEKFEAPEETGKTLEDNAMLKAKYYAEKTGFVSLSDDTGLFIKNLDGWPGIHSARVDSDPQIRQNKVLEKMKGLKGDDREAEMRNCIALYDPIRNEGHIAMGKTKAKILEKPVAEIIGQFWVAPIFYVKEVEKTYSEMTTQEKSETSHRSKSLMKMKYHIQNAYGAKHIVVPISIIIKKGKILMILRNDPHRPEYHKKWEFPGGTMEFDETIKGNVVKEAKEEAGYDVEPIKMLQYILVENQKGDLSNYQVYLLPWVCRVLGGDGKFSDAEALDSRWFDLDDLLNHELVGENDKLYKNILPELKKVIKEHNL